MINKPTLQLYSNKKVGNHLTEFQPIQRERERGRWREKGRGRATGRVCFWKVGQIDELLY